MSARKFHIVIVTWHKLSAVRGSARAVGHRRSTFWNDEVSVFGSLSKAYTYYNDMRARVGIKGRRFVIVSVALHDGLELSA